ncbi:hypothetical protein Acr_08g0008060 [Actinidia rufa]|uniref:Uncharacterized protein n=1 Tax=Actinidia rufa TaxID=165716 RepID=A0A7J0F176_9ERIC|nr:hypothetical protein Acr_08g0008060 [Actinidia rufa]
MPSMSQSRFGVITLPGLLWSDNLKVMLAVARTMPVLGNVLIELRRRNLSRLLHSDNSAAVIALARLELVVVSFISLQLSISSHKLSQCFPRFIISTYCLGHASRSDSMCHAPPRRSLNSEELSAKLNKDAAISKEHNSSEGSASSTSSFGLTRVTRRSFAAYEEEMRGYFSTELPNHSDSIASPGSTLAFTVSPEVDGSLSNAPLHDKLKGKSQYQFGSGPGCHTPERCCRCLGGGLRRNSRFADDEKLAFATVDQLKLDLAVAMDTRDTGYAASTKAQNEAIAVLAQRDKALQNLAKLQKVACSTVYKRVFNRGISCADHPVWAKAAPEVELLDFPDSYSPLILHDFNEKEYMNQPAEEDEAIAPKVDPASDGDGPRDVVIAETNGYGDGKPEGMTEDADLDISP